MIRFAYTIQPNGKITTRVLEVTPVTPEERASAQKAQRERIEAEVEYKMAGACRKPFVWWPFLWFR